MPTEDSLSEQATAERKFRARRINEQVKLAAALANTLAAAVIATAFIVPTIRAEAAPNQLDRPGWVVVGFFLHVVELLVIRLGMHRED